jgi:hypothetical protein
MWLARLALTRLLVAGVLAAGAAAPCAGCGSKISEANYFKVHHGMTEEDVDELLGPAHAEEVSAAVIDATTRRAMKPAEASTTSPATAPVTTRAVARKVKSWTRDGLTIRVVFEDGLVVWRSAVGLPLEEVPASASAPSVPPPSADPASSRQNVNITPT